MGEFGQGMMWIALLSRLGIILDRQASSGNAGAGYFGLLIRNKPPPGMLI
jgi:hypothetical protein